jgi:inhibitor of cysteine peptidase
VYGFFILFLATCLSLAAQDHCSHNVRSEDTVTVTDEDNGREVSIARGATLILRLEVRPATGYAWRIAQNDSDYLKAQGEPVFEQPGGERAGETEQQVFRFTALASGSTTLKLDYVRGWEKGVAPVKTYTIKVNIR